MKFQLIPPLPRTDYDRADDLRRAVGTALNYAAQVAKPAVRPLRQYLTVVNARKAAYVDVVDGLLATEDYNAAMNLRHEVDLAWRHARLYPKSLVPITAFFAAVGLLFGADTAPEPPEPKE